METVVQAADKASDLMQKLSLEPKSETPEVAAATKKNSAIQPGGRSTTPTVQNVDPNMYFYSHGYTSPYYFGGHDGMGDWDNYSRYLSHDGVEMTTGYYGDMYGYGYSSYGAYPYPASPTIGHDGQLNSQQNYQYPAPYFQPPSPAPYNPPNQNLTSKEEISTITSSTKQMPFSLEPSKLKANGVGPNGTTNSSSNGSLVAAQKTSQQSSVLTSSNAHNKSGDVLANGLMGSPSPWFDGSKNTSFSSNGGALVGTESANLGRNHNSPSFSNNMGVQNQRPLPASSMMENAIYPSSRLYNAYNTGLGYGSTFYDSRFSGQWGYVDNKCKSGGRGNGFYCFPNVSLDGLSELNRGPRANRVKNIKSSIPAATKENNLSENGKSEHSNFMVPDKDQCNKEHFPVEYSDAKFFVIKSYSEDDLHKSVKYNVWASTPNGNKKLDSAYKEAQGRDAACPIFLFFSVNTSGQFVGVAEMVSPVDFEKTVDYWQQDKWTGCFSVKWHIVKDVPNGVFKHIILENNDNKPVTNSRDTQEVKLEQGLQMLKLFKGYVSKTSIFDDLGFYETREKIMQERRVKQQQLQTPVLNAKSVDVAGDKNKEGETGKPKSCNSGETNTVLKEVSNIVRVGDNKPSSENGLAPTSENKVVTNGVANGC